MTRVAEASFGRDANRVLVLPTSMCYYAAPFLVWERQNTRTASKARHIISPFLFTSSKEASMEVGGTRSTWVEIHGSSHGGGGGSFHCFYQLQLPQLYSVEASMKFHIPYILPLTSTSTTNFRLLPHDSHKGPPTSVRSTSFGYSANSHGSSHGTKFTSGTASTEVGGSRFTSMEIPVVVGGSRSTSMEFRTSMEVRGSFHGSFHCH